MKTNFDNKYFDVPCKQQVERVHGKSLNILYQPAFYNNTLYWQGTTGQATLEYSYASHTGNFIIFFNFLLPTRVIAIKWFLGGTSVGNFGYHFTLGNFFFRDHSGAYHYLPFDLTKYYNKWNSIIFSIDNTTLSFNCWFNGNFIGNSNPISLSRFYFTRITGRSGTLGTDILIKDFFVLNELYTNKRIEMIDKYLKENQNTPIGVSL